ncbi:hypothetical protein NLX67_04930 [Domibacillus sp. A3M-37]|uniref:hypothetical protein n=1 Tax=Domibacillus sp. A3M-37 TaxID=2962037 RepID=UPI0020B776E5|nr:hypothetical protein [Domibacillus sp. A3M-37]MCP3761726.1 hypothetical protein [Domibacillus sp. A3M-37]
MLMRIFKKSLSKDRKFDEFDQLPEEIWMVFPIKQKCRGPHSAEACQKSQLLLSKFILFQIVKTTIEDMIETKR